MVSIAPDHQCGPATESMSAFTDSELPQVEKNSAPTASAISFSARSRISRDMVRSSRLDTASTSALKSVSPQNGFPRVGPPALLGAGGSERSLLLRLVCRQCVEDWGCEWSMVCGFLVQEGENTSSELPGEADRGSGRKPARG